MVLSETAGFRGSPIPKPPLHQQLLNSVPVAVAIYIVVVGLIIYGSYVGAQSMGYNWQWYRVPKYLFSFKNDEFQWGDLLVAFPVSIKLCLVSFALATFLGLIVALLRLSGLVMGTAIAVGFLELIRNIPLLVLLYLFYYVLEPIFNYDRYVASVLTLAVFHSALISEIFRAGINAISVGQWEAAKSIGMSTAQSYRYIILPQSIRFMLPPLTGEMVHLIKSSAIVSVIAVGELTAIGRNIVSDTYMAYEIWFTIALIYLVVTLILSIGVSFLEKRFAVDQ